MKKRNNTFYIVLLIKSILMGTVNKLPGVSGGLVALFNWFLYRNDKLFEVN